jgi:hypothetical protein
MVSQTNSPKEAQAMFNKTRTIIITLIASASFAAATVAPAVSQAEPPTGSGDPSTQDQCDELWVQWKMQAISLEGHVLRGEWFWASVNVGNEYKLIGQAMALGCSWVVTDQGAPHVTTVSPVGTPTSAA